YSRKGVFRSVLLAILVVFQLQISRAEQLSLPGSLSLVPMTPGDMNMPWTLGPTRVPLSDIAVLNLPDGYRFVDANGARVLLQRMRNPVPNDIVGLLAPNSGSWWLVLEYTNVGYVKDVGKIAELKPADVLKLVKERIETQNELRQQA